MFDLNMMNENYTAFTIDNSVPTFTISNCKISAEPFTYNNKYYIILEYPKDVNNVFSQIKSFLGSKNIACIVPTGSIRVKLKYRYNKFESTFKKNGVHLPFTEIYTNDVCNAELEMPGIYKTDFQFVLKNLDLH